MVKKPVATGAALSTLNVPPVGTKSKIVAFVVPLFKTTVPNADKSVVEPVLVVQDLLTAPVKVILP